jgi:hypothetical protein
VLHDLQELLNTMGGDVLEEQWRSTAGDERWWRPWRCVVVPGEGPASMKEQSAHEHREKVGLLFPCLIWLETGQRAVIDGGVDLGLLPAAMASDVLQAGATEGGDGGEESLQGDDMVLLVPWVGVERSCAGGSTGGRAAAEEGTRRRCGPAVLVEETEIGLLDELR